MEEVEEILRKSTGMTAKFFLEKAGKTPQV
jgi:hypothetical protein